MLKTIPYVSNKVWGYEHWVVSAHAVGQSLIDTSVEFIGGKKINTIVGDDYPVIVKIIKTNNNLSVQVHPDDTYAKQVEKTNGKTECWYILNAEPKARLVCGLNKDYTKEDLQKAIQTNTIESFLRYIPVSKGDFLFIPAGTVHAILGGIRLLEIHQASDLSYRLYDWGRSRELHINKALDVVKNAAPEPVARFSGAFNCPYFKVEKVDIEAGAKIVFTEALQDEQGNKNETPAGKTGWVSFFVISGTANLESNSGESLTVKINDTVMVRVSEIISVIKANNFSIMKIM
ncbi:MAG TPA: type I phosphomannose isomerase catalytic subunit [Treponemataceae bacterium]|nr:type I phosphomannose isomerase catalytic subunit [Treponemataceae bacterium]